MAFKIGLIVACAIWNFAFMSVAHASLKIDFTSIDGLVEEGYQGYFAQHEVRDTFRQQVFSAFGTTITLTPVWVNGPDQTALQMITRPSGSNLLIDWIGTDTRVANANPLILLLSGLPAGTYQWTSFHHDTQDQTGLFTATFLTVLEEHVPVQFKEQARYTNIDITDGLNSASISPFLATLESDGIHPVAVAFENQGYSHISEAFFVMNAFILDALDGLPRVDLGSPPTSLVINEFMASNRQGLTDGDGESSDWIELYNGSSHPMVLEGWSLTDRSSSLFNWPFPAGIVLGAGEYLVVFASGKSSDAYLDSAGYLHTTFALSKSGEYLALVDPNGHLVHQYTPSYPPQETDVSYGLWQSQSCYFPNPTPGYANNQGYRGLVGKTLISHTRGFYAEPFDLRLSCGTPDAEIRYTLDGSEPTEPYGLLYDPAQPIRVTTTTCVRSTAFKPGWLSSETITHTYLFLDDVLHQPDRPVGYPSTWAGYPADYGMDPEIATRTNSAYYDPTVKDALLSIPTMSLVLDHDSWMGPDGIYQHPHERAADDRWERAASIEYILPEGMETPDPSGTGFQANCGVKIQGESSARDYEGKHTFRLLFQEKYGPSKLRYQLFRDSPMDRFNTLSLRCCSTDSWHFKDGGSRYRRWDSQYIRDVWMRDTLGAMGQRSSHSTYVHLYVNGMYWGLYNPSERPDDAFQYEYDQLNSEPESLSKEDWDVVKDFNAELFRGNRDTWNQLMAECAAGLSSQSAYQRIQGNDPDGARNPDYPVLLDVDNLIDYMILHLYACAEDWPHHNWYGARSRTDLSQGWRFFVWDQEIVMDFQFRNRMGVNNANSPATVYAALRENLEFRLRFADRIQRHLFNGGPLSNEGARRIWTARADKIDRAIIGESVRWGDFRMDVPDPSRSLAELYTREDHWLPEKQKVLDEYIPESHRLAMERFRSAKLYPDVDPPMFAINDMVQHGGGAVQSEDVLALIPPNATAAIYYTLDGSDPHLPDNAGLVTSQTLITEAASKSAWIPTTDIGLDWNGRAEPFDDSTWTHGSPRFQLPPGGVGYELSSGYQSFISYDVESAMANQNQSCYIRIPFKVESAALASWNRLSLHIRYDDGFIAYLNGTVIANMNAPASPRWDSGASTSHSDSEAVVMQEIDCSAYLNALQSGDNLLAVHGLNYGLNSSDFLISLELTAHADTRTGQVSDSAHLYTDPIIITEAVEIKARVWDQGQWSALSEADYRVESIP